MEAVKKKGVLNLVSVGPGFEMIIPRAIEALRESEVIVAYELYLRWIAAHIEGKEIHTPPLTQERERALLAIEQARAGRRWRSSPAATSASTPWPRWPSTTCARTIPTRSTSSPA
jgi:hypothetical protein